MPCTKCGKDVPQGAKFCPWCGQKDPEKTPHHTPKRRGNGTGSVYRLANGSWIAVRIIGYTIDKDGKKHKQTVSKCFQTKREAVNGLARLDATPKPIKAKRQTMQQVYDAWLPTHQAGRDTLNCYKAAWKYFHPIWNIAISEVDIDDLQECLDDCPKGKRTKQNMKAVCGLVFKYGIPRHMTDLNLAEYLRINDSGDTAEHEGLPLEALPKILALIGSVPYADYVLCQCYLGFRPSEFLALDVKNYDRKQRAFVGGAKTEAGKNRTVTVSPKIQPIIDRLVKDRLSGPAFPGPNGSWFDIADYREAFYAVLDAAGVDNPVTESNGVKRHRYTPHSCRHTFATLLKSVQAPDKDKQKLIGHSSAEMLRYYQDVDTDSLRKITDAL